MLLSQELRFVLDSSLTLALVACVSVLVVLVLLAVVTSPEQVARALRLLQPIGASTNF